MNKQKKSLYNFYLIFMIVLLAFDFIVLPMIRNSTMKETTYSDFLTQVEEEKIDNVEIQNNKIYYTLEEDEKHITYVTGEMNDPDLVNRLKDSGATFTQVVVEPTNPLLYFISLFVFPMIAIWWLGRRAFNRFKNSSESNSMEFNPGDSGFGFGFGGLGKSNAKVYKGEQTGVKFNDVAGQEEAKENLKEIVDFLNHPAKYSEIGAKMPKGALLVGPPGTGKTLLAKAVAGEANVPFFSISGSDFVEMFVGTGASRVRDMFKTAQKNAPCIIFIDEIDAVGRQRGAGMGGGNDEREQTLNQLLVEMDGMTDNAGIVVVAATNRPDVLDPALMRSGRFDRRITVNLPDIRGRKEILEVHARNKKLASDVSLENLAKRTPGFSGADLENVLNEGAILAVRHNEKQITMADLDEAIDRVMMGPAKKSKKYTEKDKWLVSYHEAGHAVIGLKLEAADTVQKVTIIPRGEAGGYNLMMPREEKNFHTQSEYMARITGLLGGRCSEQMVFGEVSGGAVNDIEQLTKIAKSMVRVFGMSSLGPIQYADPTGNVFLGRDYTQGSSYSDGVADQIDKEVRKIVDECEAECFRILKENRNLLDLIAHSLFEYETLTNEQISNLMEYGQLDNPNEPELPSVPSKPQEEQLPEVPKSVKKQDLDDAFNELTGKPVNPVVEENEFSDKKE